MYKIAYVLTFAFMSTSAGAEDYFSNMEKHLARLSEEALFFRDHVCPTKANVQSCKKITDQYFANGGKLQARLEQAAAAVRDLETHPETASVARKEMSVLREDVLRHVRNGRILLYALAE